MLITRRDFQLPGVVNRMQTHDFGDSPRERAMGYRDDVGTLRAVRRSHSVLRLIHRDLAVRFGVRGSARRRPRLTASIGGRSGCLSG